MLPYSQRLDILKLTTLTERRLSGDLIETFKMINGLVAYGKDIFCLRRSGLNILNRGSRSKDKSIRNLKSSFLPERVVNYWNRLPTKVKTSGSVHEFKIKLEYFKTCCLVENSGNYWEVSSAILDKIEGLNYLDNKAKHNAYLLENPYVAKRKGINVCN